MPVKLRHLISEFVTRCFRLLPVRNRVFFYTIRSNGQPLENLRFVYDAVNCKKVLFAHMLPHSFPQMMRARYYLLTSRVIVTDDYIRYLRQVRLRPQQKVVQLWHAAGAFKRFGLDAPSRLTPQEERSTHDQYTDVIVSSEDVRAFYAGAFGVPVEIVRALGVPRTDRLLSPSFREEAQTRVFALCPKLKGKTVYLYAPTFREIDGTVAAFDPALSFEALDAALEKDEMLVVRRHPVMEEPFFEKDFLRICDLSELSTLDLLAVSDVLITDYSSLIFDAALLGVPTVFYCPDLSDYERSFYLSVPGELPGEVLTEQSDLLAAVRRAKEQPAAVSKAFLNRHLAACDGRATCRVAELIESYIK